MATMIEQAKPFIAKFEAYSLAGGISMNADAARSMAKFIRLLAESADAADTRALEMGEAAQRYIEAVETSDKSRRLMWRRGFYVLLYCAALFGPGLFERVC